MESFLPLLAAAAVTAAGALILVAAAAAAWNRNQLRRRYHPVAGTIFHQVLHFSRLHDYHTELSRRHKTYRLFAPFTGEVYTCDPAVVEHIVLTHFHNYGKGWYSHDTTTDLMGDGIFVVDGDKWRHQRKLASYEFSTRALRDYSGTVFKKNAAKLARGICEAVNAQQVIDIQDWLMKSTMDSIFEVAFGIELNCLQGSNEDDSQFVRALNESSVLLMWRFMNPLWKMMRWFNVGSEAKLRHNIRVVDQYIYRLIHTKNDQVSTRHNREDSSVEKEDMLSRFLLEREKDPKNMSYQYLRDIVLSFVIAGKDTTAGTLAWFFYMLCKHPSVQSRIAEEVAEAVVDGDGGTPSSFGEFADNITEKALAKMQYLHAALSETLRLYPAVPQDSKVCFSDETLPDGFDVKRGEIITYQPYVMGRMTYIWGEDAEVFRPERWLNADGIFSPESPFKFTAFQAGPRICLGKEFAYRQMKIFAATLVYFFMFKLSDETKAVNYRTMLTLHIDQGLHLRAGLRQHNAPIVALE
ncbi:hypothetical protein Taro_035549 [Colocasia esculenta]|uniref:Uncharacterized protein n=1 Tax=Colocasia esculenta TaxID=4460 RepID=A0A843W611_COLES|nr:hypothetical protein [Colocasia esculenta]